MRVAFLIAVAALIFPEIAMAYDLGLVTADPDLLAYDKAVEGTEVVLNKLFPKKSRVELDAKFGIVLNSSYVQTFLANAGLTYFWSEEWGFNVEGNFAITSDKPERGCIENFYNDPNFDVTEECGDKSNLSEDTKGDANMGPAYVPIRQLKYIFDANFIWNQIYGKQIVLLSATNYFDFYLLGGGGLAMSNFYPKQTVFRSGPDSGKPQRGTFCVKADAAAGKCPATNNPGTRDDNSFGTTGRPVPLSENNVTIHLAIGQRFHFFKRFLVTASLEDYLLVGTESGFDNFLTIMGGLGVRF